MAAEQKVLISAIGGDIGQSVARVLKGRFQLIGCDMSDVPYSSFFVDKFYKIPSASEGEKYFQAVEKILGEEGAGFFCPISEPEIIALDQARSRISAWPARVLLNNQKTIGTFSDKLATAEFLAGIGKAAPRTVELASLSGSAWDLPFIVKDRRSCGSKSVWIIREEADLAYAMAKNNGRFIAQQYLENEGQEFTTGVFSDGRRTASITFRRNLGFGGLSREVELVHVPYLSELAQAVAEAVGLQGAINIQSRKSGELYLPFEVNPRISSTVFFRFKFGFDDVAWWINALQGGAFDYSPRFSTGRAFRYLEDCFIDMQEV